MDEHLKVIGIEVSTLREMMSEVVREEVSKLERRFMDTQRAHIRTDERLFTKDVAKRLRISRQTVLEYRKKEILPQPQFTAGGRAYWTEEQVTDAMKTSGFAYKYDSNPARPTNNLPTKD